MGNSFVMHEEFYIVLAARRTSLKGQCLTKIVSVTDKQLSPLGITVNTFDYYMRAFILFIEGFHDGCIQTRRGKICLHFSFLALTHWHRPEATKLQILRNKTKNKSQFLSD